MSKRFHDTELWQKAWFLELPPNYKIAYYYLISHCDNAGLIVPNMRMLNFICGTKISQKQLLEHLGDHIMAIEDSDKWYLHKFNDFQYGELRDNNNAHKSVIKKMVKYGIPESLLPLTSTSPAPKSTVVISNYDDEAFEAWYNLYDKKVDLSIAKNKWKKVNKSLIPQIMEHTRRYVESTPDKQFRKAPAVYLNQKHWENEVIDPDAPFEEPENAIVSKWKYHTPTKR